MHSRSIILVLALLHAAPTARANSPMLSKSGISVAADGSVYRGKRFLKKVQLPPKPRRLEVQHRVVEGKRLLWIRIHGADERVAELLYAGTQRLYTGLTGPQGVDGEWSRHLAVSDAGVVLYERRPGVARCGEKEAMLFPRRYDFARQRFRRIMPRRASGKIGELRAAPERPPLRSRPLHSFYVAAVSSHRGDGETAAHLAPAAEAADGRLETAWKVAGASIRGAFLTLRRPPSPYPLRAISLVAGDAGSEKAFEASHRIKTLLLQFDGGLRYRLRLPHTPARRKLDFRLPYRFELPRPYSGRCLSITVEDHYPGPKSGARTLALAEVRPITTVSDDKNALPQLVEDLRHEERARRNAAARILARQRELAIPALAAGLPKASGANLERLVETLARLRDTRAARIIFTQLPRLSASFRERLEPALRALGADAVPLLEPLMRHSQASLRHYAFRLLGQIATPAAQTLLIARVGRGSRPARKAVADALGLRGRQAALAARLLAALAEATFKIQRADLVLLLGRLTPASARKGAMDALVALWPRASDFETRVRLLSALPRLDARRATPLLRGALLSKDSVIRWRALQALLAIPDALAPAKMIALLRDADPRVREAAAEGLRMHRTQEVTRALTQRLLHDRWPQVARKAATSLAGRCEETALLRFRQAVRKRGFGIDALVLSNIAACRPRWLLVYLLTVAAERRQPTHLRRLAAGLLPPELVKRHLRHVTSFFLNIRREALGSAAAEQVTASVIQSLGRSGHPQAARPLADALALDPSPLIRASAARALQHFCDTPVARLPLQRALNDPSPLVAATARNSLVACGKL